MSLRQKLSRELKAVAVTTLYFAAWAGVLVLTKKLILDDYHIPFGGLSLVLLAAVVFAKVVLVLEHVPLGGWIKNRPAMFDMAVRTILYGVGVLVVMMLEKAFEARHEYGGFGPALVQVYQHRDMPHVWVNTLWAVCALLVFNALSIVRLHLGKGALFRLFLVPPPREEPPHTSAAGNREADYPADKEAPTTSEAAGESTGRRPMM